jgi:hypothetical protein
MTLLIRVLEIPAFIGLDYFFSRFSGEFVKFRKAPIGLAVSARIEQLGSHWTDFYEI